MKSWAATLLLFTGCVVPQNVEQAPPAPSDQPPFVTATYPPQGTITVSRNCPGLTFKLYGISDCDLQDSVEVQWLTNYDPKSAVAAENKPTNLHTGPGGRSFGCTRDPGSDSWDFNPTSSAYSGADQVQVEALLSDGFDLDLYPKLRTAVKGRMVYRVAWTIQLTDAPCVDGPPP